MVCMEMDFCPCWGSQRDTEISELCVGRSRQPWGATARVASESPRSGQPPGTTSLLPRSHTSSRSHFLPIANNPSRPFTPTLNSS